ncbi:MAG: hypothetical protein RXR20_34135, partial [Paraburkholderia sp.]
MSNRNARWADRAPRASAVSFTAPFVTPLLAVAVLVSASLSGCSSIYSESATAGAGIAGAAIAGKVTRNA